MKSKKQVELEDAVRMIGHVVSEEVAGRMPAGSTGYALILFDFGAGADHFMAYTSNARRADVVKTLRELADKMEAGSAF